MEDNFFKQNGSIRTMIPLRSTFSPTADTLRNWDRLCGSAQTNSLDYMFDTISVEHLEYLCPRCNAQAISYDTIRLGTLTSSHETGGLHIPGYFPRRT